MQSELWRVYRVAKLLDVTKKRIYQMVREGKLDAVRLGPRSMRITRESIDRFIRDGARHNREELGLDYRLRREQPASRPDPGRRAGRFAARTGGAQR